MFRRFTSLAASAVGGLVALTAAGGAFAHPGHGEPATHAHPEFVALVLVLAIVVAVIIARRA